MKWMLAACVTVLTVQGMAQLPSLKLPGHKKPAGPLPFTWTVRPEWVRADEEFLASDALAGRGSATRDEEIAASYVASQFVAFGLTPAPGTQGFIQAADVIAPTLDGKATLGAGGVVLVEGQDMDVLLSAGVTVSGPLQRVSAKSAETAKVAKGAVVLLVDVPKGRTPSGWLGLYGRKAPQWLYWNEAVPRKSFTYREAGRHGCRCG